MNKKDTLFLKMKYFNKRIKKILISHKKIKNPDIIKKYSNYVL